MTIAPVHASHDTEPTPLFYAALKAHNTRVARADVRAGLRLVTAASYEEATE